MDVDETMGKGKLIDELFGEFCEGTFLQPTFITDYPVEMSDVYKRQIQASLDHTECQRRTLHHDFSPLYTGIFQLFERHHLVHHSRCV